MRELREIVTILGNLPTGQVIETGDDGMAFALGKLRCIVSVGEGWDHVSVSLRSRTPNYREMKRIKRLCFLPDEWAIEYHPPGGSYISIHDNVLHLWRPHDKEIPIPPEWMV